MRGMDKMERERIESLAYELLEELNYSLENPVDVIEVAKKMDIAVGTAELEDGVDGFLLIDNDDCNLLGSGKNKVIGVNAKRKFNEKRFIIAHEIGHYKLNYNNEKQFAFRESAHGRNREENDVDFFAACLLMPKAAVIRASSEIKDKNIIEMCKFLANKFNVPVESMIRRLQEVEIIAINEA